MQSFASAAEALIDWYDRHHRDLPWRASTDPYPVWISEVMLQQTRSETVIPYFGRFLERFPSVEDLAEAEEEEVLALWSGLGYYRRARQLHAAAKEVARLGGFPQTLEGLRGLPGIGEYTAAAVGSIAFGLATPVMDGNVERVVSRLLASEGNPKARSVRRTLLSRTQELLAAGRPGDSNQALMELGATVCLPKKPQCLLCPLSDGCEGLRTGAPERFPPAKPRRKPQRIHRVAALVSEQGLFFLVRRPAGSEVLAGTWELPWVLDPGKGKLPEAVALEESFAETYGGCWSLGETLGTARHTITFRALEVEVRAGAVVDSGHLGEGVEAGFYGRSDIQHLPVSSLLHKTLRFWSGD